MVGAAGQEVPFLGYVELDVSFPRTEAGIDNVFQTLVLVVPDNQYNLRVPLILGTNLAKQCRDVCQQQGTGKKRTLHRNLLLPYHVPHETSPATVATRTDPGPRNQSLGHPDATHPADVSYDEGHEELEPIAVVTTEDSILNSDASPFVPAAVEDQPLEDPPPEDVPIHTAEDSGSIPPEDVLPTGPESAGTMDDAEPVGPVAAVTTRSGRAVHPPDRVILNSVWAQVRSVLRAWLGD